MKRIQERYEDNGVVASLGSSGETVGEVLVSTITDNGDHTLVGEGLLDSQLATTGPSDGQQTSLYIH